MVQEARSPSPSPSHSPGSSVSPDHRPSLSPLPDLELGPVGQTQSQRGSKPRTGRGPQPPAHLQIPRAGPRHPARPLGRTQRSPGPRTDLTGASARGPGAGLQAKGPGPTCLPLRIFTPSVSAGPRSASQASSCNMRTRWSKSAAGVLGPTSPPTPAPSLGQTPRPPAARAGPLQSRPPGAAVEHESRTAPSATGRALGACAQARGGARSGDLPAGCPHCPCRGERRLRIERT